MIDEVGPVAEDRRDDRRGLDHVGDRAGEAAQHLPREALLVLGQAVRAVFREPALRLGGREALVRLDRERRKNLLERRLVEGIAGVQPEHP